MNLAEGLAGDWYLPFNGKTIHQETIKAGHVWSKQKQGIK